MAQTKILWKSPTTGNITENLVPAGDVSYWKTQGWYLPPTTPAAPTTPAVPTTPTTPNAPEIPNQISTDDLTTNENADVMAETKVNQDYKDRVLKIYEERPDALANKDYIQAVSQAHRGKPATEDELKHISQGGAVGGSLRDVLTRFGLIEKSNDLGVGFEIPEGKKQIANPTDRKNFVEGTIAEDPTGTYLYGTPKPTTTGMGTEGGDAISGEVMPPATGGDAISDLYDELISEKVEGMAEGVDMGEFMTKKHEAAEEVEKARQAIADKQLIDAETIDAIGESGHPMSLALVNRDKVKYTQDEYITNLKMAQDYNNKLILSKMAEGNFLEAQRINKDIANDVYEIKRLQLDQLIHKDKIKADQADRLEREIDWERKLAFDYGYTYIPDMETYNAIVKKYNITPANFDNFIYKEGDKMYLKSLEEEMSELEFYEAKKQIDAKYKTSASRGGGSSGGGAKPFKFSSSQRTDMIGTNITNEEMLAIETNLANGYSLNEIMEASDFSKEEKADISRIFTGEKEIEEEKSFIDDNYIKYQFEAEIWKDADKMFIKEDYPLSKYDTWGWQSKAQKEKLQKEDMDKAKEKWVKKEMQDIKNQVKRLKEQGFNDKEIDKML